MMSLARFHRRLCLVLPPVLLGLALLQSCVPYPNERARQITALPAGMSRIALLPVLFADRAQDRYVEYRTGEEIIWQTRRVLENKGYSVTPIGNPSSQSFIQPFAPPVDDPAALASLAPSDVDAVMVIRIDHFLDAALYGGGGSAGGSAGGNSESLDLYATAELISRQENRILWQRQGFGKSNGFGSPGLHEIRAARDLVDALFSTLPEPR